MSDPRKVTNELLDKIAQGILDEDTVINACLSYMSEDDVADMCQSEGFLTIEEDEETYEDEDDEDEEEIDEEKESQVTSWEDVYDFLKFEKGYKNVNPDYAKAAAEYINTTMFQTGEPYTLEQWFEDTKTNYPRDLQQLK